MTAVTRRQGFSLALAVIVAGALAIHAIAIWSVGTSIARGGVAGDWIAFHTGARIVESGELDALYDLDTQSRVQDDAAGAHTALAPYVLPAFVATALSPIAKLPVETTYWIWMVANVVMLASLVAIGWRHLASAPRELRLASVGLAAASIPVISTLMLGQLELLILTCIGGSYALMARGKPAAGGALLALAMIKPHIALPFVALLLLKRQWSSVAAFSVTAAALLFTPALIWGTDVVLDQITVLRTETSPLTEARVNEEVMINLRGLITSMDGPGGDIAWIVPLAAIAAAALYAAVRTWIERPVLHPQSWAIALILPLVCSPHVHMQSMVLLVAAGVVYLRARTDAGAHTPIRWPVVAFVLATACWLGAIAGFAFTAIIPLIAFAIAARRWPQLTNSAERAEAPRLIVRSA